MTRSVQEIAGDLKQAVTVMAETSAEIARQVTGSKTPPSPGATPKAEVRLPDGRIVELGALADELLEAVS